MRMRNAGVSYPESGYLYLFSSCQSHGRAYFIERGIGRKILLLNRKQILSSSSIFLVYTLSSNINNNNVSIYPFDHNLRRFQFSLNKYIEYLVALNNWLPRAI